LLIPVALAWVVVLGGVRLVQQADLTTPQRIWVIGSGVAVALLAILLWPRRRERPAPTAAERVAQRPEGSFPLPPLDLVVPPSPRAVRELAERSEAEIVSAGGGAGTRREPAAGEGGGSDG